jgi:ubiquinone/menaquinone biosynthesis C-methylase UbiE
MDQDSGSTSFTVAVKAAYRQGAGAYAATWHEPHPWMQLERDVAATWLKPGMSLIDIGCGPGRDAKYWSDRGVRVLGVDNCAEMVERARAAYPHLEFLLADMLTLNIGDAGGARFDCAWLAYILLHLPEDLCRPALENVRRLVRPHGVVFIATTIAPVSRDRLGPIAGLKDADGVDIQTPTHEWSLDKWAQLMESIKFVEKWSRVTDFMSGKSTILSAIYASEP